MKFGLFLAAFLAAGAAGADHPSTGRSIYRSNCAFCHGLNGRGGRGPDLVSGPKTHGDSPEALEKVIRDGVPGTAMPSFSRMEPDETRELVEYLLELSGATSKSPPPAGDPAKGRAVYTKQGCAACHRVGAEGSVYGPDLTRIGAARSTEYLWESLVSPSADIPPEYEGVTVVAAGGRRISGIRLNEDTFSVQLRDAGQNFQMLMKEELRQVIHETKSLMPSYQALPRQEIDDLLAYLYSLRGEPPGTAIVKQAQGIR